MGISRKVRAQMGESSWIRRMFEVGIELKARHGPENVFDLSLGNPILEPPGEFRRELLRIAQDDTPGTHRYMPNAGYPEVRDAIAAGLSEESGLPFSGGDIVMSCGAGGALNVVLKSLLDPGDEVIVLAPFFAEYLFYVDNHGGSVQIAGCREDFLPDTRSLERALNERTRAVILNSPNNPSGVVYPPGALAGIAARVASAERQYGTEVFLISDEPYRKLLYTEEPYPFVFPHHVRSIVVTSHSKDLGLAGERIGYIAVHPGYEDKAEFVDAATYATRTLGFVNAPAMMQRIVARLQHASVDVDEYRRKRDFLYAALTDIGYECVEPQGAFYMFPKTPIPDDRAFVARLQSKLVLTVPGVGFGMAGHFRLSFCVDDRTLEGAVKGLAEAFREVA